MRKAPPKRRGLSLCLSTAERLTNQPLSIYLSMSVEMIPPIAETTLLRKASTSPCVSGPKTFSFS